MKLTRLLFSIIILYTSVQDIMADSTMCPIRIDSLDFVNQVYWGNNQYLTYLADSINDLSGCNNCRNQNGLNGVTFNIPVTAWTHNNTTGGQGPTANVIEHYINEVNRIWESNNINIILYLKCTIENVTNNTYYDGVNENNWTSMIASYRKPNSLNIHFVNYNSSDSYNRGRFPWKSNPYSCYIHTSQTFGGSEILAHEIGHTLGLLHTHESGRLSFASNNAKASDCLQESVNRTRTQPVGCLLTIGKKKCEVNGDGLCDTDADPLLREIVNGVLHVRYNGCMNYIPHPNDVNDYYEDNWGDAWLPSGNNNALYNLMSYGDNSCDQEITNMQSGIMYYYTLKNKVGLGVNNNPSFFYTNTNIDSYENDNFWRHSDFLAYNFNDLDVNNKIDVNNNQYHTFHHVPNENGIWSACDIDWLYFYNPASNPFIIKTAPVTGQYQPDTKLEIYTINASNGVLSASPVYSNDNISSTNKFSKISATLSPGYYAIKVTNNITSTSNNGSKGHYLISVEECSEKDLLSINAPNGLCSGSISASITNLPAGATVSWSVQQSPTGIVTTAPSGNTINITKTGNGRITLTATVTKCGRSEVYNKSIDVGLPSGAMGGSYIHDSGGAYPLEEENFLSTPDGYDFYNAVITPVTQPVRYPVQWSLLGIVPTGRPVLLSQAGDTATLKIKGNSATAFIKATVTSACGSVNTTYSFSTPGSAILMTLSPNPADDNITVALQPEEAVTYSTASENTTGIDESYIIKDIWIYDKNGYEQEHIKPKGSQSKTVLSIDNYPPGLYYIVVSNGIDSFCKSFIVY